MTQLRYLRDVVTLELDADACTGCGMCEVVCPHVVFAVEGRKTVIIDRDACIECGACAMNCPTDAIFGEGRCGVCGGAAEQHCEGKNEGWVGAVMRLFGRFKLLRVKMLRC